jgi:propanol-preferring alcohol dehydrogenase
MATEHSLCMRLHRPGQSLRAEHRSLAAPTGSQVLLRVRACGVCRTDLHVVDGDLPDVPVPIIPGHEIVGEVIARGPQSRWPIGVRVGVPWLGSTCGTCRYCRTECENLCDEARFTGYQLDGGYAQHAIADSRFCFELPATMDDAHAAPLLCAGLIGYRSLRMTADAHRIGIYGFGAAAHIVTQVALWQGREVYAFTRAGDLAAQSFARSLGAAWTGDSETEPPALLDAAIIFAPVGGLIPVALRAVRKGGVVVCGGIHMSDIPQFPYSLLWGERCLRSVANLTRRVSLARCASSQDSQGSEIFARQRKRGARSATAG